MTSQNLANAFQNMSRIRIDATGNRVRLKDGERRYPKSWSGSTSLAGFARESLDGWDMSKATKALTDIRHPADGKHIDLDFELALALANVTEGAARSTFLKSTQVEPSHGFVAWQALVDGYAPESSNDPSAAAHTCDTQKVQRN